MRHNAERTSPMGGPFKGKCVLCGKPDLTPEQVRDEECPNPGNVSAVDSLILAIDGPLNGEDYKC